MWGALSGAATRADAAAGRRRSVRLRFRLAAVGVFVLPAAALALVLSRDVSTLPAVLPMHLLMGLLVLQPRPE